MQFLIEFDPCFQSSCCFHELRYLQTRNSKHKPFEKNHMHKETDVGKHQNNEIIGDLPYSKRVTIGDRCRSYHHCYNRCYYFWTYLQPYCHYREYSHLNQYYILTDVVQQIGFWLMCSKNHGIWNGMELERLYSIVLTFETV